MDFLIFVPGHTIVRMPDGGFKPSDLYQRISFPDPMKPFPFRRTGVWEPDIDPDGRTAYLGGGEVAVKASTVLYRRLQRDGFTPALYMVGGRSDYLAAITEDRSDVHEAGVMKAYAQVLLGKVNILTVGYTRTTEDDVRVVLEETMLQKPFASFVVMMAFRLARAEAILQKMIIRQPWFEEAARRMSFVPAEQLVPLPDQYQRMTRSKAYARTMENERHGIRKMLLGEVASTGGKT